MTAFAYELATLIQAQERAKAVQTAFQEARAKLVRELPPILEQLRTEVGAVAILDGVVIARLQVERSLNRPSWR